MMESPASFFLISSYNSYLIIIICLHIVMISSILMQYKSFALGCKVSCVPI